MSISLVNGSAINQSADVLVQVLDPTVHGVSSTGKFYYDLYLKSTNAAVTGEWKQWDGSSSYVAITGTHGGVAYSTISAAANGSVYKTSIESNATNDGKFQVDHTGTGAYLDYWYVLRGPGLPTQLQGQSPTPARTDAHTREFFLHADRQYTFTANVADASAAIYFTWQYYDGAAWVAYDLGTANSFVGMPPASGRVRIVFTLGGYAKATTWSFKALY